MIIWQIILTAVLIGGFVITYAKNSEGETSEAGEVATGIAALVGGLLIFTGFFSLGSREDDQIKVTVEAPEPPQVKIETRPMPESLANVANNSDSSNVQEQPTTNYQIMQPQVPDLNLGNEGLAFDRVEAIMMKYKQLYHQAANDIQRTDLRFARGRDLCANQGSQYSVLAKLGSVSTNKNGDATVSFDTNSGMELIPAGTFSRGDPVHTALGQTAIGSPIIVTFKFQSDETGKDCFHSHRWTERNNMTQPQWDINLIGVTSLR